MPTEPDDPTAAIELAELSVDARSLGVKDFADKHGGGFLLQDGNLDPNRKPLRPQPTLVMSQGDITAITAAPVLGDRFRSESARTMAQLLVYPIKHTGRSPFPRIVTVGRTKNNDIVLSDISISKFHAFFKEEDGTFYVADGESRNGTFVDGERVLTSKQGKPTALKKGARVKFGGVELRFADVAELVTLARTLS
jgi:FHA domain